VKLVQLRKVHDDRNHNAFTDLCVFRGDYYLSFRTSTRHVHPDGRVLVLRGAGGRARWIPVAQGAVWRRTCSDRDLPRRARAAVSDRGRSPWT